jgi:hypothetical protein
MARARDIGARIGEEPVERLGVQTSPSAPARSTSFRNNGSPHRADGAPDEAVQVRADPVDRALADHVAGRAGPVEHLAALGVADRPAPAWRRRPEVPEGQRRQQGARCPSSRHSPPLGPRKDIGDHRGDILVRAQARKAMRLPRHEAARLPCRIGRQRLFVPDHARTHGRLGGRRANSGTRHAATARPSGAVEHAGPTRLRGALADLVAGGHCRKTLPRRRRRARGRELRRASASAIRRRSLPLRRRRPLPSQPRPAGCVVRPLPCLPRRSVWSSGVTSRTGARIVISTLSLQSVMQGSDR